MVEAPERAVESSDERLTSDEPTKTTNCETFGVGSPAKVGNAYKVSKIKIKLFTLLLSSNLFVY